MMEIPKQDPITIYADPPREQGFGWTVMCSECDFSDQMLSKEGAENVANGHAKDHLPEVVGLDQEDAFETVRRTRWYP